MASTNFGNNTKNLREYLQREENISYQDFENILRDATDILQRCINPGDEHSTQGLIYGHVQSGKTAVIITTLALAADNGYRNFIVMTSDLNDIYNQTLERIQRSLDGFEVLGKSAFQRYTGNPATPLALVSSKNTKVLSKVSVLIQRLSWQGQATLIIDDEADQASLDTNINDPNRAASSINREITNLRKTLVSYSYLQTTATPQALLLQNKDSPFKPNFVVSTTPGERYIGGNHFFSTEDFNDSNHIRIVPMIDVSNLRNNPIPDTVAQSILVFFVGAAILRIQGSTENYTYLLHTSFRQNDHSLATQLVDEFRNQLGIELNIASRTTISDMSTLFRERLEQAYTDLQQTFPTTLTIPTFDQVIAEAARAIASTEVVEINSRTKAGVSPNPSRRHTLYIGGTKIGRGVTIKKLLVTYYGRDALKPQIDTVLQHARMYGYRQAELAATRIYLPQHLGTRFFDIHQTDNIMRDKCRLSHEAIPVIPLMTRNIKPTRRNVLDDNTVDVATYLGGQQYFPLSPISDPGLLENQTEMIDNFLSTFDERTVYSITTSDLLYFLKFKFALPQSRGAWEDESIRQAISALQKFKKEDVPICGEKATLVIVSRNSNRKKDQSRDYKGIGSVLPGGFSTSMIGVPADRPALLLTRFNGEVDTLNGINKGWDGSPFWVPVIQFPDGNYAFSVNRS
jgi:Z1 domain